MIVGFADRVTEKVYMGEELARQEKRQLGDLDLDKAQERLAVLNRSTEHDLLTLPVLRYRALHGIGRYSIDANSRRSRRRITFVWMAMIASMRNSSL